MVVVMAAGRVQASPLNKTLTDTVQVTALVMARIMEIALPTIVHISSPIALLPMGAIASMAVGGREV